ncbi:bifunctional oligoribonuclease/PAP phosphatase NrnA [Clostridium sp. BJN0001]|uniref:DHH family phosphoesterase n=1 Tax=Clostridium sp. BJN0001 TaxID=2930219 RepID=UPI001FD48BFC|nr:bifunctional oligoribonuclease/PAP phosphatase NrnA [Clostridium sp. BJN0001]
MDFKEIVKKIKKANRIGLSFHISPDGDAIGSTLALLNTLRTIKKDAYIISTEILPDNLSFLSYSDEIDGNTVKPDEDTDLIIILDCGNMDRIAADLSLYNKDIINIDHHISNENYGILNYVDSSSAATCELSYLLSEELGVDFSKKTEENIKIGTAVYTGIVTDTGSFRHSNVTERTHKICSKLIGLGIDNSYIHSRIFDNKPLNKLRLTGYALSNVKLVLDSKVAIIKIPNNILKELDLEKVNTSDIVSTGLSVKGVLASILLKETEEGIKTSLRSKDKIDVRNVAEQYGGGGHIKAAGGIMRGISLDSAEEKIIKLLKNEIEK